MTKYDEIRSNIKKMKYTLNLIEIQELQRLKIGVLNATINKVW